MDTTTIKMIDILQMVILKTDLKHTGKDVQVVIPMLRKSTKRSNVEVDWGYLEPVKEGNDTVVEFTGVRYHIWDDFHDYAGRYNNKEDIKEHLNKYQSWFYEKNEKTIDGSHHFGCIIYWKAMEVE